MTSHVEKHFTAGNAARDIVSGMSGGLTVPFASAAGLAGVTVLRGTLQSSIIGVFAAAAFAVSR